MYEFRQNLGFYVTHLYRGFPGSWNDRVTYKDDKNEESRGKQTMTEKSRNTKRSQEEQPIPLANRISSHSIPPNSLLASRIKQKTQDK
ncbi:hypothetical protein PCANC_28476 [Puccinia coronata f. sp. avenae]|uniref:Uncharacterized protein n=1 Tax=Puccinia coronata f. sp. avenae TaxID=200324 RepID=A0A2N5UZE8_9BASI|nr:hypothetical protein PCANC_28476 [Puccinia coronata f. sp. avenae]PLW43138.1 hypothetical protein PCASD_08090 [Puccinia coronata f. sp. avenae]